MMGTWQKLGSVISRLNSSQRCQKSCLTDLKGVHHVAKNCLKKLATLKTRGKNFGDMFFDVFWRAESESEVGLSPKIPDHEISRLSCLAVRNCICEVAATLHNAATGYNWIKDYVMVAAATRCKHRHSAYILGNHVPSQMGPNKGYDKQASWFCEMAYRSANGCQCVCQVLYILLSNSHMPSIYLCPTVPGKQRRNWMLVSGLMSRSSHDRDSSCQFPLHQCFLM